MTNKFEEYLGKHYYGYEFDYLISDQLERLAIISTAGHAPISEAVVDKYKAVLEETEIDIHSRLKLIETRTTAIIEDKTPKIVDEWRQAAERGIYVYDWQIHDGPYVRQMRPKGNELLVHELPSEIQDLTIKVPKLNFEKSKSFEEIDA